MVAHAQIYLQFFYLAQLQYLVEVPAGADLGLNFWGGTDDVGGVISGCGQLRLPDLFLRSQNFEG